MSINHYSTELPESHHYHRLFMDPSSSPPKPAAAFTWLTPYGSAAAFSFNLNTTNDDDDNLIAERDAAESAEAPKELLFEKPLTPSDVGKLNRLVIPKQHAEKCFPLNGGESGENGLLLSFEDEVRKLWRFRYSYWNSSQSYVLTKGWSRFVKEKQLDAGDVVVFSRHRADACRLFIGWRRRNSIRAQDHASLMHPPVAAANGWNRIPYSNSGNPYQSQHQLQPSPLHHGGSDQCPHAGPNVLNQTATSSGSGGNSKRLRLFGVNLECQAAADESEPCTTVGSPMYTYHNHHQYHSSHMDTGGDAYWQG